ncbi:porin [Succinivibrio dextrinosolvens]|jgi:predicted porin|uniref:porin n=1 Tax=Succinivibrio dextrinosolvens TaxID=83771 RepID=UPI00241F5C86|nr:porin [Succinivibrio dextrinosolvens]MBE6423874.1 porin [Succinivibrio dextrinosolvens]
MKKSLLALAVVAVAASANAGTVYDKDGTKLYLDGRVQSVFYNGNHAKSVAQNDSNIKNTGRFGIGGKTQITDWVAGFGYAQWDVADGSKDEGFEARDQYVGADFGDFGKVQAGRYRDSVYYVENITDHYEDAADNLSGNFNGARRGGQLTYTYDNYGFHGQLGVQTAQDNAKVFSNKAKVMGFGDKFAIDSGVNLALGYTIDDVVFGPLSFRAGYNYMKGQKDNDFVIGTNGDHSFDKFKHAAAGVQWGNLSSGLFLGALYDYAKFEKVDLTDDDDAKVKGFELIGGYAFDNGVSFLIGYESAKYERDDLVDFKVKRIPVFVNYKLNPNFNIWTEAGFNAGSDHGASKSVDKTVFSVGARYTF